MITLTKLNGVEFVLNSDYIETVQESPDTTIQLTNGKLYIVRESAKEVVDKTISFRNKVYSNYITGGDING